MELFLHLGIEIRVNVQTHAVGIDLFDDIKTPLPVFCYDFEVAWVFHQQLQCTVFQVL